jgi:hypothetical protein
MHPCFNIVSLDHFYQKYQTNNGSSDFISMDFTIKKLIKSKIVFLSIPKTNQHKENEDEKRYSKQLASKIYG